MSSYVSKVLSGPALFTFTVYVLALPVRPVWPTFTGLKSLGVTSPEADIFDRRMSALHPCSLMVFEPGASQARSRRLPSLSQSPTWR